jgi:hypothetical protein
MEGPGASALLSSVAELVRASGLCSVCDHRFRDELVLRVPDSSLPGGWAYIEVRHLHDGTYEDGSIATSLR